MRQEAFLLLTDIIEALYGGAARGGKTDAALMAAAQFVHVPGYAALLLRESYPDLMQPDGLIPRSKEWWRADKSVKWHEQQHQWTFPSGATITFGHLGRDDDVYQYQGSRLQYIAIDELTQHSEWRYRYLFSRLSRPEEGPLSEVPLRMRGYTNPGGKGHEWVKLRFIDPTTKAPGAVFVPARVEDNPTEDREAYVKSLSYLDPITRAQLLAGDWDAYAGGRFQWQWFGKYFRRGDYAILRPTEGHPKYGQPDEIIKPHELPRFMTVDPAASSKKSADYTVISVWAVTPKSDLMWLDCIRFQKEVPDIVPEIQQAWIRYRPMFCGIEAVAANSAVLQLAQRAKDPAMIVTGLRPAVGGQIADKLTRATPAIAFAASGRIWTPLDNPSFPLDAVRSELTLFTGNDKVDAHDDIVDSVSMAVECHTSMPNYRVKGGPSVMGGATGR